MITPDEQHEAAMPDGIGDADDAAPVMATPLTDFEAAVDAFCLQQVELRARLARSLDGTGCPPEGVTVTE